MRWAFGTLLGVAFVAALFIVAFGQLGAAPNRVYTVAEVQAGLRQHPQSWAGRTVQVTGDVMMRVMGGCPTSAPACLSVAPRMRRPLLGPLYDLPLVGDTLSRLFPWRTRLIVSVRLTSLAACPTRGTATCPDGTVLAS
ncbi:MAG: hypothetical protein M3Y74_23445 [Chloroflexota bacterium]|nr:hypothetical protein [Chloroflexota bacterium]